VPPLAISTIGIVLLVLLGLLVLLVAGGYVAAARRARMRERELKRQLRAADEALAQAHASDKGWERSALEAAARKAFADRFGDGGFEAMHLVQVIDRPGTDADQAVFRVQTPDGEHRITLGRTGGVWGPA
jgi:type II secretory pathway pseudopilin PulG